LHEIQLTTEHHGSIVSFKLHFIIHPSFSDAIINVAVIQCNAESNINSKDTTYVQVRSVCFI